MSLRQGMVQHLKNENGDWNLNFLRELFTQDSVRDIYRMFWANNEEDDKMIWVGNMTGLFSVKSFYRMENWNMDIQAPWWRKLWNSKIHERQKFVLWKIAHNGLSVKQNLIRTGIYMNDMACLHGCCSVEDEVHVFFSCPFAKGLWFDSPWGIRWEETPSQDIKNYLKHIWNPKFLGPASHQGKDKFILYSACIIDHIWWTRNEIFHKEFQASMTDSTKMVNARFEEFNQAFRFAETMEGRQNINVAIGGWQPPPRNSIKFNTDVALRGKAR